MARWAKFKNGKIANPNFLNLNFLNPNFAKEGMPSATSLEQKIAFARKSSTPPIESLEGAVAVSPWAC